MRRQWAWEWFWFGVTVVVVGALGYWQGQQSVQREAQKVMRRTVKDCAQTWQTILQVPVGELVYVANPPIVVFKDGLRHLRYQPIPTAGQRRITNLFAAPPGPVTSQTETPVTSSTTTTAKDRK